MPIRLALSVIFLLAMGCKPAKEIAFSAQSAPEVTQGCPADGNCTVSIKENQALSLSRDESGTLYYTLKADPAHQVLVFSYQRSVPKGVQDGTYREEIILELDHPQREIKAYDFASGRLKALFGRFCYCKGATGYYAIKKGTLDLSAPADFQLDFEISEVPQVLKKLGFRLK